MNQTSSPILPHGGYYSLKEAARLLRSNKPQTLLSWLKPADNLPPVILRQYEKNNISHEIGFYDLMEMRFITHFRKNGYSLQFLRKAAEAARNHLSITHPFSYNSVKFQADKKRIFIETAKEMNDVELLDLISGQFAIHAILQDFLDKELEFDASGIVREWRPLLSSYPHILCSPRYASGMPVIGEQHIPTGSLFKTMKAENDLEAVADYYHLTSDLMREALNFEIELGIAA